MRLIKIVLLILGFSLTCLGQRLTATYGAARLEYPMDGMATYYDGVDSIYLFGGRTTGAVVPRSISVYSISQDTITIVGSLSTTNLFEGCVESDINGNLYYFIFINLTFHEIRPKSFQRYQFTREIVA